MAFLASAGPALLRILPFIIALLAPAVQKEISAHARTHARKSNSKCRFCTAERRATGGRAASSRRSTKTSKRKKTRSTKSAPGSKKIKGNRRAVRSSGRKGNIRGLIKAIAANKRMSPTAKRKALKTLRARL